MMHELGEHIATKSVLFGMADGKVAMDSGPKLKAANPDKYFLMGADPRLPKMPEKPTLIDFFNNRFASLNHLLQSADARAQGRPQREGRAGVPPARHRRGELHPLRRRLLRRADDRGPYVDEEVRSAVRTHQALRFFADPSVELRISADVHRLFRADYKPEPYIVAEYERARTTNTA